MTTEHDKALQLHASRCLHLIRSAIPGETRVTLLVRRPDDPTGDSALMLSDDNPAEAARVIGMMPDAGREVLPGGQIIEEPAPELASDEAAAEMIAAGIDPNGPAPDLSPGIMQHLAERIDDVLNGDAVEDPERKRWGFALLAFAFNTPGSQSVRYVSSAERRYMADMIRAWLANEDAKTAAAAQDSEGEAALRSAVVAGRA